MYSTRNTHLLRKHISTSNILIFEEDTYGIKDKHYIKDTYSIKNIFQTQDKNSRRAKYSIKTANCKRNINITWVTDWIRNTHP